jgi:hypothetical protein
VRPSSRPALLASAIKPQNLNLRDGERKLIVCPDCHTWRALRRNMIWPHHPDLGQDGRPARCPGSGQRIIMDITVEQWGEALAIGSQEAAARGGRRQFTKPALPAPTPVHRMAGTSEPLAVALERAERVVAAHRAFCKDCAKKKPCKDCTDNELCWDCRKSELCRAGADLERRLRRQIDGDYAMTAAYQRAARAVARHRAACTDCQTGRSFCPLGHQLVYRLEQTEDARIQVLHRRAQEQKARATKERRETERLARRRSRQYVRTEAAVRRTDQERLAQAR